MDIQSPLAQRLERVIKWTGLKPAAFARKVGVKQPAVALILGGHRHSISTEMVEKITECYSEISTDFLLFGRGEMLKDKNTLKNYLNPPGTIDPNVMEERSSYAQEPAQTAGVVEQLAARLAALEAMVAKMALELEARRGCGKVDDDPPGGAM